MRICRLQVEDDPPAVRLPDLGLELLGLEASVFPRIVVALGFFISDDDVDAASAISSGDEMGPAIPLQPQCDAWVRRSARYGIPAFVFQTLLLVGCPPILFNLLWFLNSKPELFPRIRDIHILEMFSGVASIYAAAVDRDLPCAKYDFNLDDVFMNFMIEPGFLVALVLVRRMAPGALSTWATKCSNWIWLVRSVTRRSKELRMGPAQNPHPTIHRDIGSYYFLRFPVGGCNG